MTEDSSKLVAENISKLVTENVLKLVAEDISKLVAENVLRLMAEDASKLMIQDALKPIAKNFPKLTAEDVSNLVAEDASKIGIPGDVSKAASSIRGLESAKASLWTQATRDVPTEVSKAPSSTEKDTKGAENDPNCDMSPFETYLSFVGNLLYTIATLICGMCVLGAFGMGIIIVGYILPQM